MEASPFRQLRDKTGMSGSRFAAEAGLSRQAVTNLEAGMYPEVPLRANTLLTRLCAVQGIDARSWLAGESLDSAMNAWKKEKRRQRDLSEWPVLTLKEVIARFPSPGSFCRELCIPTSAIYHVMYGRAQSTPDVIKDALADAGYRYGEWL